MNYYFKKAKKDTIMTEGDDEDFEFNKICRVCEKEISFDKVRDHCHLHGEYRRPPPDKCNINVTQKQNDSVPFIFHILVTMIAVYFLKS